jgi:hypothetical protein
MFSDSSFSIFYYCTIVEFLYTWSQTKLSRPMPSTQHNINFVPYQREAADATPSGSRRIESGGTSFCSFSKSGSLLKCANRNILKYGYQQAADPSSDHRSTWQRKNIDHRPFVLNANEPCKYHTMQAVAAAAASTRFASKANRTF